MNTKVSLVIVVGVLAHASFWTPCHSFPYWGYLFSSDEKTSAEAETKAAAAAAESEIQTKSEPAVAAVTPPTTAAVEKSVPSSSSTEKDVSSSSTSSENSRKRNRSGERLRPLVQNAGIARGSIGFLAGLAKLGTDGLKSVVQTGTDFGSTTIDQASMLQDRVIDSTQSVIEKGTQKSLDNLVPVMSRLDTYRRSFSGGTKGDDADKAHSITITTSSQAPINSMYSFAKDFMPAGATGSSALPPITSIDFSKFLR